MNKVHVRAAPHLTCWINKCIFNSISFNYLFLCCGRNWQHQLNERISIIWVHKNLDICHKFDLLLHLVVNVISELKIDEDMSSPWREWMQSVISEFVLSSQAGLPMHKPMTTQVQIYFWSIIKQVSFPWNKPKWKLFWPKLLNSAHERRSWYKKQNLFPWMGTLGWYSNWATSCWNQVAQDNFW